eukprot:821427_1
MEHLLITDRVITPDKIILSTTVNKHGTMTVTKPHQNAIDLQIKLNMEELKTMEHDGHRIRPERMERILEISRQNRCIYYHAKHVLDGDILCKINGECLNGLQTVDVIKTIEYAPLPFELTFKTQKKKLCPCGGNKGKQKDATNKPKHSATTIALRWIIKFMKLSLNIVAKSSSMLDAVTDIILLYKSSQSGMIVFTMVLFLTLLAPYVLSYSSGVRIFLYHKTFENVDLFTFKSLLLGLYLFPTGI